MDEEQPKKKITLSNFFESIQSIDKVANRALKKTDSNLKIINSNLGITNNNKSLIKALSKSFNDIVIEVKEIKEYITIKDEDKDKLFSQEDQEQKIKRLERLQGIGDKPLESTAGTTDDSEFKKQAAETVKKALEDPNIMQMFTGLIGLSVSGLLGLGVSAVGVNNSKDNKGKTFSETTGGIIDALTGNITDFDRKGGKTVGVSRAATGIIDFFTANMFDLDKRGGLFESEESFEKRQKIDKKIEEEKKNKPNKGLMRLFPSKSETIEGKDKLIIILGDEIAKLDKAEQIPGADLDSILTKTDTLEEARDNLRFNEKDNQFGGYDYLQKFLKEQNQEDIIKGFKFGTEIGGVDGPDGVDRIPAMLTKGETVLSKDESENLKEMGVFNVDRLVSGVKKMYNSSEDKVVKNPFKVENTNTPDFALLTAISALEGGDSQARVDVAQSIYNRYNEVQKDIADGPGTTAITDYTRDSFKSDSSGVFPELTLSDILLRNAQYQPTFINPNISDTNDPRTNVSPEFLNVSDRESAILAMKSYYDKRGDKRTMKEIESLYDQTVLDLQDQKVNKSASAFVGGNTEFRSGKFFEEGDQYRGELGVDNTFFSNLGTGTQLETGSTMSPLLKSNLQSNILPIIESKTDQLAQNIFTSPTTESNKVNLLPIPVNQSQPQPVNGNVPVAAPQNSPQVTTTPVASTISSVSFINMISNKQLSIG